MKVALFVTCLVDNFYPNVAEAMVQVLNRYGVEVELPLGQTCCGQPAFNSGYVHEAREVGRGLIDAFDDFDYVVSPSGSCTGMVHHYYSELYREEEAMTDGIARLTTKTYEFSQFLVHVLGVVDVGAVFPYKVTYHPSCHGARLLGVKDEPLRLLQQVSQLEFAELPHAEDCCGFGGTFAVKMHDISTAMVTEKANYVLETQAEVLVGTDMGCLMNIGGRLRHEGHPVRVLHLAELLLEGIGLAEQRLDGESVMMK